MPVINPSGMTFNQDAVGTMVGEFMQDEGVYIAPLLLPVFETRSKKGAISVLTQESMMQMPQVDRTASGHYPQLEMKVTEIGYNCTEKGIEQQIDDGDEANYANVGDLHAISAKRCADVILRRQEYRTAQLVNNTSTFTGATSTLAVTNEWDDAANATPKSDVNVGKDAIRKKTGVEPNTLVIAYSTFLNLGVCNDVVNRIKYTNPGVVKGEISADLLAQYFGVERVLVGRALYNSANNGLTPVGADIWDKEYAFLCITNSSPDLLVPQIGRTLVWPRDGGQMVAEVYRDESRRSDVARARQNVVEKLTLTNAGFLFTNITT